MTFLLDTCALIEPFQAQRTQRKIQGVILSEIYKFKKLIERGFFADFLLAGMVFGLPIAPF
jgi:hypothetical protein